MSELGLDNIKEAVDENTRELERINETLNQLLALMIEERDRKLEAEKKPPPADWYPKA